MTTLRLNTFKSKLEPCAFSKNPALFLLSLQLQLVVLGSMILGSSLIPVESIAESLQVAHDAGAKRVLFPMSSVSHIARVLG